MIKALAITGPTASGKTELSLELAEKYNCEIISCDSMQIYKGMDIGTAKATEYERTRIPHHMLDFLDFTEPYSAGRYREDALACAQEISKRNKLPLFVGGTGLYMDTLIRSATDGVPAASPEYTEAMARQAETEDGITALYQRLTEVDPESAAMMHRNNVKRVIRALEIYDTTGKPKSYFDRLSRQGKSDIQIGMITLDFHNRENLYKRIDDRVDAMLAGGLIEETRTLISKGFKSSATARVAIGYKELFPYIDGDMSLAEATEVLKTASRRYAKRQLTWFRHNTDAERIFLDTEDGGMKGKTDTLSELFERAAEICNNMQI